MAEATIAPSHQSFPSKLRHHPLTTLREEMDDLLSRFVGGNDDSWLDRFTAPAADLSETDTSVEVNVDLPGVDPNAIDIRLNANTLTVRGERNEPKEDKGRTFHRVERRRGSFSRSITLPCPVSEDEVAADYINSSSRLRCPRAKRPGAARSW